MQNYHSHKSFSNINTPFKDSAMSYEDYCKRAVELGQQVVTSVDHGTQGNYLRCWQAAQKHGLKFVYGVEAYWVKDRIVREELDAKGKKVNVGDKINGHIIVLARNINGIHQINEMLSSANETGFYRVPRVDLELLKKLNPADVLITTACVSFWGKIDKSSQEIIWHYSDEMNCFDEIINVFSELHGHFGSSIMLEVQCHNTIWQKQVNRLVLMLHYKYGVALIAGMDSHYIYDYQKEERKWLREESGVHMDDEDHEFADEVYEDYPDEETFINRFRNQGILNESEIMEAVSNTDVLLTFDDIVFDQSRKLPTIYPNLTQEQRNQLYLDLVYGAWEKYKPNVPEDKWDEYEKSFYNEEAKMVVESNMSDYFLLDHEMVKLGKKMGGMITPSGRGSSGSWFTNSLLGMSTLDRFELPVPLYPARFCTADRLKTSCPDLDLNLSDPSVFAKAQEQLLGSGHSYPMIAYGTLKYKSAFKLYARAQGIPADEANNVSKQIDAYERAIKEADDEDEKELIQIDDYVDPAYMKYIEGSEPYRGIVVSKSQAPCAYMIYNGDIRSEVGIMRINANGGKKIVYTTVIDGYTAEEFGYIKNDLLCVTVIAINSEAMRRAGIPQYTSKEIIELTKDDPSTWDVFSNGWTQGINQCQGAGTTDKLKIYKPRSLQDLSAFVAAIRPGFKSMAPKFLNREKFNYGIPSFDSLLKNDSTGSSWLLYQEDIMKCLGLAGFNMEETYPIIKAISKKKIKVIAAAKEKFVENFTQHVIHDEGMEKEEAIRVSERIWQIIIDSSQYSFNASHAVAVAIDALYGAYLKAHYPMEYYSTLLDSYAEKGNKDKVALIKSEMKKAFGISVVPCRFRQDNRSFYIDRENKHVADALTSVKYISRTVANSLYKMRDMEFESFTDLLCVLDNDRAFNSRAILILIRMGYFSEFGSIGKLLSVYEEFANGKNKITKQLKDATREKRLEWIRDFEFLHDEYDPPMEDQIAFEAFHYGTPLSVFKEGKGKYVALEVETKFSPKVKFYSIYTGDVGQVRFLKKDFNSDPIEAGDIVTITSYQKKPACTYVEGKRVPKKGVFETWVYGYSVKHMNLENKEEVS